MAIHLRVVEDGSGTIPAGSAACCFALARRRHYEEDPLDLQRLPAGLVRLRLEPLPE
jgi:hypothetical protein